MAQEEKKSENATIVEPDFALKKKVGNTDIAKVLDKKVVERAQEVVEKQKDNLANDMIEEVDKLERFYEEALSLKDKSIYLKKMTDIALNIKSDAAMAGRPLATDFAKSLYQLCMALNDISAEDSAILRAHIHAIRNVFTGNISDGGGETEQKLLKQLSNYTEHKKSVVTTTSCVKFKKHHKM